MKALRPLFAVLLLSVTVPVRAASGSLLTALLDEDWKTATRLVEKGAELEATATYGRTPLMLALSSRAPKELITLLLAKGASVTARDAGGDTPLHKATCWGDLTVVRQLLEKGADAKARENYGRAPVEQCLGAQSPELHDLLVSAGGAPAPFDDKGQPFLLSAAAAKFPVFKRYFAEGTSPDLAGEDGTTLLMTAASYRSTDTVRFLLEKGARKDLRDSGGRTAAFSAALWGSPEIFKLLFDEKDDVNRAAQYETTLLMRAAMSGNPEMIRFLLAKGANPSMQERYSGSPLYYAASSGCLECVKLLRAEGAPLMETGRTTPLHTAASRGNEEVVKFLLDEGTPVGVRDGGGSTPAHSAAGSGKTAVLKLLKARGADLAAKDNNGSTPAVEAASNGRREALEFLLSKTDARKDRGYSGSILYYAANSGRRDIVEMVLDEGADLAEEREKLLLKAAEAGAIELVELFLEKKADPNYADGDGRTPLMAAASSGSLPAYKRLLAAPGADIARTDKKGRGLVHYAARGPRGAEILRQVLNTGGDARARDSEGYTPLHLAAEYGGEENIRLLLERGADFNAPVRSGYYAGRTPAHLAVSRYGMPQTFGLLKARGPVKTLRSDDANTFAHLAAYAGRPEVLRWALDEGVPVDEINKSSETALMKASTGKVARLLLDRGADIKKEYKGYYAKRTPLHFAAYWGRLGALKVLVERGAPLNAVSLDSHTALSLAAADGKEAIVQYLLSKGADPKADLRAGGLACEALKGRNMAVVRLAFDAVKPDFAGEQGAVLLDCAKDAPSDAVREMLDAGARQSPDAAGALLRHWAGNRAPADLRLLSDRGYDVRAADVNGYNALMAAAYAGRVDNMKFLLERGLAADAATSTGWTPLAYAAGSGNKEAVDLLLEKGASVAATPSRVPVIYAAVERRRPDMIRYLASKKADANAIGPDGIHPFHKLFANYSSDDAAATVEALYDAGANADARDKEGSTALHKAASNGSLGMIKAFIAHRMKVDTANNAGYTPLAWAFTNGRMEAAKLLLDAGAKLAAMEPASSGDTLSKALDRSDTAAARLLLEKGYPVDKRGGENWRTPLINVAGNYYDSLEPLQLLLEKGAALEATDKDGRTALLNAVSNDREAKVRFLVSRGANVQHKDSSGRTALHIAANAWRASTATVNLLLDKGAPANEKDKDGSTPLHLAVGKPSVLEILARRGWSLNTDNYGRTALHLAVTAYSESTASMKVLLDASAGIVDYSDSKGKTPLMYAASDGDRRLNEIRMLVERKASVTARDNDEYMTPLLHLAYGYGGSSSTGAARVLLDAGAEVGSVDKNGSNALAWAVYRDRHALAELLLERGADFDTAILWGSPILHHLAGQEKKTNLEWALSKGANIDVADKQGRSVLHTAASSGRLDSVKYLIAKGANPNALDASGNTPLKLAESAGQGAVIVYLRDRTSSGGAAPVASAPAAAPAPAHAPQAGVSAGDLQNLVKAAVQGAMDANKPAPVAPKKAIVSDVDRPSYKAAERPNDVALVIGIERYSGDLPSADHAERDAEAVKAHFSALGVPARNLIHLTGSKAGRASIEKYVEQWLPRMAKPDSRVYVYFSGHGAPDVKTGSSYLVPWDGDPNFLETTAYPVSRLYAKLDKLQAQEVLVAMDACFSGAKGRSVLPKGARPLVTKVALAVPSSSKVVALSASDSNEITGTYDEQGHGLFTYYLLKGLNGAASSGGGVTVNSLYQYLKPKVQDEAGRSNREQTPQLVPPVPGARGEIRLR